MEMTGPNRGVALQRYRQLAGTYDRIARRSRPMRERAVDRLALRPGETLIDVACGTGLSFSLIQERIGPEGFLIGIDLSPEMLAEAQERVKRHAWKNVTLLSAAIEEAPIPVDADASLFVLTHDVMRSRAGLENVINHTKPGGRVVATGAKWAPWWALSVNPFVWLQARRFVTTFEGFSQPWSVLASLVPDLEVEPILFGGAYVASASLPANTQPPSAS